MHISRNLNHTKYVEAVKLCPSTLSWLRLIPALWDRTGAKQSHKKGEFP